MQHFISIFFINPNKFAAKYTKTMQIKVCGEILCRKRQKQTRNYSFNRVIIISHSPWMSAMNTLERAQIGIFYLLWCGVDLVENVFGRNFYLFVVIEKTLLINSLKLTVILWEFPACSPTDMWMFELLPNYHKNVEKMVKVLANTEQTVQINYLWANIDFAW